VASVSERIGTSPAGVYTTRREQAEQDQGRRSSGSTRTPTTGVGQHATHEVMSAVGVLKTPLADITGLIGGDQFA
jgi:hypothetical protein